MSVGDGGGNPVTPLSTMTKLVNERFRAQINDIVLDPATPDLFTAELFIPQAEGGWYTARWACGWMTGRCSPWATRR